jgi:toxin FitB
VTELIVLDTNVISEISRDSPEPAVSAWFQRQQSELFYTTSVTLAEVLYGLELLPQGKRRERLTSLSRTILYEDLSGRILTFDEEAARHYARILSSKRLKGISMSAFDAQIAAIAFAANASVATRNVADFDHCGITVVNPWSA